MKVTENQTSNHMTTWLTSPNGFLRSKTVRELAGVEFSQMSLKAHTHTHTIAGPELVPDLLRVAFQIVSA
eukprot:287137-Amphidinium_carterae.1